VALSCGRPDRDWEPHMAALVGCELVISGRTAPEQLVDRLHPQTVRAVAGVAGLGKAMRELGRRVAGRSVGVVLSGGGARAFAHLGAIERLRSAGVPIDAIAGVSLGSIVAALFARGDSPEAAYAACERQFVRRNPTNDYTLPLHSLIRGRKTARFLLEEFGDARIESLDLPYFCASTDLNRREILVHRTGPVAEAILASLSIPGVFPPVQGKEGRLLVDGGVLDNLPVREMARSGCRHIVAVDVTGTAAKRGAGTDRGVPRLGDVIVRCVTLASADTVAEARDHADLVITPDVARVGLLDWRQLPAMRRAGAVAAEHALAAHPDLVARLCD